MNEATSSLSQLWKSCSAALCDAASTVKGRTRKLVRDWKHGAALVCVGMAAGGVVTLGQMATPTEATARTLHYEGNTFDLSQCICNVAPWLEDCTCLTDNIRINVEVDDDLPEDYTGTLLFAPGSSSSNLHISSATVAFGDYALYHNIIDDPCEGRSSCAGSSYVIYLKNGVVDNWQINIYDAEGNSKIDVVTGAYTAGDDEDIVEVWPNDATSEHYEHGKNTWSPGAWTWAKNEESASPKNCGMPPCPRALEKNPINAATGNKLQIETDYTGAAVTGLEVVRAYNSQDAASSPFGANWTSTWHRSLTQPDASTVKITREDGRVDTFKLNGGAWTSDSDVTSKLVALTNGWRLTREDDSKELYTLDGRLSTITTRAGLVTKLAYNAGQRLTKVTGPFGHTLTFAYNGNGLIDTITQPDGNKLTYGYDTNNNPTSVTYPDGKKRQYLYENTALPHALTGIVAENAALFATYGYDGQGRAITSEHAGGAEKVAIAYDTNKATVTDSRNNKHGYNFTTQFGLVKPTTMDRNCCGGADYTYDANGFLASRTDFNGNTTAYTRDARGLELSRTEGQGTAQERTITTKWHGTFRLPTRITEPGRVTAFAYDAKGNLKTKTVTAGTETRVWSYTYNDKGQVLTIDGSRTDAADVTTFAYDDASGNLTSITNALGHVTKITRYNANGYPLTIVDPNGLTTTLGYDKRGRLVTQNEGGEITRFAYTAWGDVRMITLPDGSFLAYTYDAAHRLTRVTDTQGNRIVYTLDKEGNRTKEEVFDSSGNLAQTQSRVFDTMNRLAQIKGANQQKTVLTYDNNDNVTGVTDPLLNTTANAYDALDRLIRQTDPNAAATTYGYNTRDEVTSVTDPRGLKTSYTRNGFGEVTATASPDSGKTTQTYDAAGNVVSVTDAKGQTTTYKYDALNRLTQTKYADGKTVTYQYDQGANGLGRLSKVTDPTGSTTFTYDKHGRETSRVQKIGAVTLTTRRAYDAYGRPESVTYPSGKKVTVVYDVASKLPAALLVDGKNLITNIAYRPFGPVAGWTMGNGEAHLRSFDQDGLLQGIAAANDDLWLPRDDAGRITELSAALFPWKGFTYDKGSRLIEEMSETAWRDYVYDANGNRTSGGVGDVRYDYTYAAARNRLLKRVGETAQTFTYDAAGNMTGDGSRAFVYGADGRLASATKAGVTSIYAYNGLGNRVSEDAGGAKTLFVYDGPNLMGEYTATGAAVQETAYFANIPVGVMKGAQLYYVNPDHLGAPRTIQNQSKQIVWQWDRDAFGNGSPNQKPGSAATFVYNLRLPGQYHDKETGLLFNNARYYAPELGRYTQSDPIGLAGGVNPYIYVVNNPVNLVDPWGFNSLKVLYETFDLVFNIKDATEGFWEGVTASSQPYSDEFLWNPYSQLKEMVARTVFNVKDLTLRAYHGRSERQDCEPFPTKEEWDQQEIIREMEAIKNGQSYLPRLYDVELDIYNAAQSRRAEKNGFSFLPTPLLPNPSKRVTNMDWPEVK